MSNPLADPWRLRCPNGHTRGNCRPVRDPDKPDYYCHACKKHGDDPRFDRFVDAKTDQRVVA